MRGETVVIGAASSGVGTLGIQIAAASGAHVVAVTSSPEEGREALAHGASSFVDRTSATIADDLSRSTGGRRTLHSTRQARFGRTSQTSSGLPGGSS